MRRPVCITAVLLCVLPGLQQQQPTFRTRVDVVTIELRVVDGSGRPVADLRADELAVTVDGRPRKIAAIDYVVHQAAAQAPAPTSPAADVQPPTAAPVVRTVSVHPGRTILLVVDESNLRAGYGRPAADALQRFVERADQEDRIGLVTLPPAIRVEPTRDRKPVIEALGHVAGRLHREESSEHTLGLIEALAFESTGPEWVEACQRECNVTPKAPGASANPCVAELEGDARRMARDARQRLVESTSALAALIPALGNAPAPRLLILVSEELPLSRYDTNQFRLRTRQMEADAARVQASVYVLQPHVPDFDVETRRQPPTSGDDAAVRSTGLETVTSLTGGSRLMVSGRMEAALDRVALETSASYVLGIVAEPGDRDGRPHEAKVTAKRKGVSVRARKVFVFPPAAQTEAAPAQAAPTAPPAAPVVPAVALPPPRTKADAAVAAEVGAVVERAGRYVVEYGEQMSVVIGVEQYMQWVDPGDSTKPLTRTLRSEFALVRVKDDWLGFRDVYEVGGKPVSDHQDRLLKLLQQSPAAVVEQGRKIAEESARYNIGSIHRTVNVPTMALLFLHPANQGRFQFTREGDDTVNGTKVWRIRYEETRRPTMIGTSAGKDLPVVGTLWVVPADGRVLKTRMEILAQATIGGGADLPGTSDPLRSRDFGRSRPQWIEKSVVPTSSSITVTYRLDDHVGLVVPAEMLETYHGPVLSQAAGREVMSTVTCRATYSDFKRFETTGRIISK